MALKKMCNKQGCCQLIDHGNRYCEQHQQQEHQRYDQHRESAAKRGYDHKWRQARITYLKRNPLCVQCMKEGKVVAATVVDHIIAHKGNQRLFWDKSNWQPLCKLHHDQKTVREDGGFGTKK